MKPYLETDRMIFLNFEKDDRPLIKELDSNPDVVRYTSHGIPSDDVEVDRVMKIFLTINKKFEEKFGVWKVVNKESNEFMGWFHFRPLKSNMEDITNIELGYRFRKKFWGQGFATEGSQALIHKGFNELNVKKVWAHAMLGNSASINVMKKAGLIFDYDDIYEAWPGEDKRCVWYSLQKN